MPRCSGLGASKRPTSVPSAVGCHGERGKAAVHPDEPGIIAGGGAGRVAAGGMQVGGSYVEADIPTGTVTADRGEQDLATRRHHRLPGVGVEMGDRAKVSPQPTGIVVDADRADGRQGHGAGMALPDPDREGAALAVLVAEPKPSWTAPLAFPPREAGPPALAAAVFGVGVGESARPRSTAASSNTWAETSCRHPRPVTCLVMVPSGAATKTRPAASPRFQALKALIRSNPATGP